MRASTGDINLKENRCRTRQGERRAHTVEGNFECEWIEWRCILTVILGEGAQGILPRTPVNHRKIPWRPQMMPAVGKRKQRGRERNDSGKSGRAMSGSVQQALGGA